MNDEGYEYIPIKSHEYSKTLKENLKTAHAPALLYAKGNNQIMQEKSEWSFITLTLTLYPEPGSNRHGIATTGV